MTDPALNPPGAVYYLYDKNGTLLYVGATSHPRRRFGEHRCLKAWWPEVDESLTKLTWFTTRDEADVVEAQVIADMRPVHNVQGVTGRYYGQQDGTLAAKYVPIAARLESIPDPAERARQVAVEMAVAHAEQSLLAAQRRVAIAEMRSSGKSVIAIAKELGIQASRVYVLLK